MDASTVLLIVVAVGALLAFIAPRASRVMGWLVIGGSVAGSIIAYMKRPNCRLMHPKQSARAEMSPCRSGGPGALSAVSPSNNRRQVDLKPISIIALALGLGLVLPAVCVAADRFTPIIEQAGEPTVTKGGFLVNQKRVAVQGELSRRPPTPGELGAKLPPKAALKLEPTARQIAQYHPVWRVYDYRLTMPRPEFIRFFEAQGLVFDTHRNVLLFPGAAASNGELIDGLVGDPISEFRVWRRP